MFAKNNLIILLSILIFIETLKVVFFNPQATMAIGCHGKIFLANICHLWH
jgi:hypothetical protein